MRSKHRLHNLPLVLFILGILLTVFGVGIYGYALSLLKPVDPQSKDTKVIIINKGESFASVSQKLSKAGLVRSPLSLKFANYLNSEKKPIQAGGFKLSPSMTPAEILDTLAHGKIDLWVRLLEGWRREEMAENLAKTFAENNVPFSQEKFLTLTKDKEGYLFPDTYLFPLNSTEETVASILESTLTKKITPQMQTGIDQSGKNLRQILTMASIIEREARSKEARRLVSGILWKRVESGWPLQADATLQFAKGYDASQKTWWKPPTGADKTIGSPYNTYQNPGLPPGPICAPSLDSLEAAIFPKQSEYWYYITDNQGQMHYSSTLDEHSANIAKYLR